MKKLTLLGLFLVLLSFKSNSQVNLVLDIKESEHLVYDSTTIVIITDLEDDKVYTMNANTLSTMLELDKTYRISFIRHKCISKYIEVLTYFCDTHTNYQIKSTINLNKGSDDYTEFGGIIYYNPSVESFTSKLK